MTFSSPRSLRATPIKHYDRGFTLVFGSDGQVSLLGFDGGIASEGPYTLSAAPTPGTNSLPSESTSTSPVPNLEATSASLTGTLSSLLTTTATPISTSSSSSLTSSSYDLSSTATDTDTNIPSIPTVNYPTPSPTAVSDPKDHGVGAPFYLAIVLASISFIGCVSAFIAWWIRSRSRKDDLELDDPWNHRNTLSDGSSFADNANASEKGAKTHVETEARPYYLPASIVRRSSSNLLAVPHTIPTLGGGTSQSNLHTVMDAGRYPSLHPANDPHPQNVTVNPHSRPYMDRLQTELSVQESTRTLGRLRVANRVPGDVTSGDEGGMNIPRLQNGVGPSVVNTGEPDTVPVGENAMQNPHSEANYRLVQEGDATLEPPGPATYPWGRRTDTVAALRRTRRAPGTTVQTYKNAKYGGYLYPSLDGERDRTTWKPPTNQEEDGKAHSDPSPDPLGWKGSLKSSFWLAVDAMTGNRPAGSESRAVNAGSGSRFTPAPQRVASRRSPVSPTRPATGPTPLDSPTIRSQETAANNHPTLSDKPIATQGMAHNTTHQSFVGSSTRMNESGVPALNEVSLGRMGSLPLRVSHLNRNPAATTHRHPDSLKTDAGSVYSTDSAAARANLRKYGYGDPIPSSWSALAATRESQLDLDHMYLPPPRPMSRLSSRPFSTTPSQLTLESGLLSSSASARARTPMHSEIDLIGSDAGTLRSGKSAHAPSYGETVTASSMYSMSRNGTIESGRGTIGSGTMPSHSSSTASSVLSRKKGVASRRKRPRPPLRAPSSASSVHSIESGLSIREVAVRRALLERRRKVKETESLKGREDSVTRASRDGSGGMTT